MLVLGKRTWRNPGSPSACGANAAGCQLGWAHLARNLFPVGACKLASCAADESTVGKARIGFVSRYKQGATPLSGNEAEPGTPRFHAWSGMQRWVTTRVVPILCALVLGACSSSSERSADDADTPIQTDRKEYVAQPIPGAGRIGMNGPHRLTLVTRYHNRSSAPVYLGQCGGLMYSVQSADGDGRTGAAYTPLWQCPETPPVVVQVGEIRVDTIQLRGPTMYDHRTGETMGTLEGRMRLVYQIGSCPDVVPCLLPVEARRSNPFRVEIQTRPRR